MKQIKASFTIEAAVILPMVFIIQVLVLYTAFAWHDKCVIEAYCLEAADRGNGIISENQMNDSSGSDWERYARKSLLWRLLDSFETESGIIKTMAASGMDGKLIISHLSQIMAISECDKVEIQYYAEIKFPFRELIERYTKVGQISGKISVSRREPEEFIRLVKGVLKK